MLKEIYEQPSVLERIAKAELTNFKRIRELAQRHDFRLIVLVGRGSSHNAALFGRYLIEITTGLPVSVAAPSVHTLYRARLRLSRALVVGISQSGESHDVNLVLEASRKHGAFTLGITNQAQSSMAKFADEALLVHGGPERSVPATKTYTGQMLLLYGLAWALGASFSIFGIFRLPQLVARALRLKRVVEETVEPYRFMHKCLVIGRGLNYANASELSLKLMETCYVMAERFSGPDLVHGPIAVVDRDSPIFVFAPTGATRAGTLSLIKRLRTLGAYVLVIGGPGASSELANRALVVPGRIDELWTPIPYIVPAQLLVAGLAEARGLSADEPRHLEKITRTV